MKNMYLILFLTLGSCATTFYTVGEDPINSKQKLVDLAHSCDSGKIDSCIEWFDAGGNPATIKPFYAKKICNEAFNSICMKISERLFESGNYKEAEQYAKIACDSGISGACGHQIRLGLFAGCQARDFKICDILIKSSKTKEVKDSISKWVEGIKTEVMIDECRGGKDASCLLASSRVRDGLLREHLLVRSCDLENLKTCEDLRKKGILENKEYLTFNALRVLCANKAEGACTEYHSIKSENLMKGHNEQLSDLRISQERQGYLLRRAIYDGFSKTTNCTSSMVGYSLSTTCN